MITTIVMATWVSEVYKDYYMRYKQNEKGVILPYDKISPDALQGLVEELVTRDGTDGGYTKLTLEQRVNQVRRQLISGDAVIVYDLVTETANIVSKKGE